MDVRKFVYYVGFFAFILCFSLLILSAVSTFASDTDAAINSLYGALCGCLVWLVSAFIRYVIGGPDHRKKQKEAEAPSAYSFLRDAAVETIVNVSISDGRVFMKFGTMEISGASKSESLDEAAVATLRSFIRWSLETDAKLKYKNYATVAMTEAAKACQMKLNIASESVLYDRDERVLARGRGDTLENSSMDLICDLINRVKGEPKKYIYGDQVLVASKDKTKNRIGEIINGPILYYNVNVLGVGDCLVKESRIVAQLTAGPVIETK